VQCYPWEDAVLNEMGACLPAVTVHWSPTFLFNDILESIVKSSMLHKIHFGFCNRLIGYY
jgi:hypothetical protein